MEKLNILKCTVRNTANNQPNLSNKLVNGNRVRADNPHALSSLINFRFFFLFLLVHSWPRVKDSDQGEREKGSGNQLSFASAKGQRSSSVGVCRVTPHAPRYNSRRRGRDSRFRPQTPFFFFQSFSRDGSARLAVLLASLSLLLFSCLSLSTVVNPFQVLAV